MLAKLNINCSEECFIVEVLCIIIGFGGSVFPSVKRIAFAFSVLITAFFKVRKKLLDMMLFVLHLSVVTSLKQPRLFSSLISCFTGSLNFSLLALGSDSSIFSVNSIHGTYPCV